MKTYFLFICAICCYLTGNAHSTEYNIFQFGASKDTSVVQTQAINAAIENCHRQGGGKVIIPSGIYKSGTIFLKDNVELHLESGAYLYAVIITMTFLCNHKHLTVHKKMPVVGFPSSMQ